MCWIVCWSACIIPAGGRRCNSLAQFGLAVNNSLKIGSASSNRPISARVTACQKGISPISGASLAAPSTAAVGVAGSRARASLDRAARTRRSAGRGTGRRAAAELARRGGRRR